MHQRPISKVKTFCRERIHSIPILLKAAKGKRAVAMSNSKTTTYKHHHSINSKLKSRYWSIIPLGCMLALLLLGGSLVFIDDSAVYAEGISTYAATSANPTVSLTIGGDATNKQVITSPGNIGYRSHTVTVGASDVESYSMILSGPTNLESNTSTTVGGADNKTPESMSDNTWGYSWGADTKETATYQTLSTSGAVLSGDGIKNFQLNFTKNLFFAAKFADDAEYGNYHADVTLSLAATPRAIATGFANIRDMQEMTPEICSAAAIGDTGSLEDIRDGSVYTVAKLSDRNCWMTQNLRIIDKEITPEDSNVSESYIIPAPSLWGDTASITDKAYYNDNILYGAYYTYYTATAGTNPDSGNALSSICPKGWRLPTRAEYDVAVVSYANYNFVYAGHVYSDTLNGVGSYGSYWSGTANDSGGAYDLLYKNDNASIAYNGKYGGYSVRCVAEKPAAPTWDTITEMQEMTPEICAQGEGKGSKILSDSRDKSTYTVQRLSDGKCWMTQNLRIVNKKITSADSNVSSDYTIPMSALWSDATATANKAYYNNDTTYGAYYTYYTATAGINPGSGDAVNDICPKNWRLPMKTEYDSLISEGKSSWTTENERNGYWVGAADAMGGAFFPAAGYVSNNNLNYAGSNGSSWSSTANGGSGAYYLNFHSGGLSTGSRNKYDGSSVRCVAK